MALMFLMFYKRVRLHGSIYHNYHPCFGWLVRLVLLHPDGNTSNVLIHICTTGKEIENETYRVVRHRDKASTDIQQ